MQREFNLIVESLKGEPSLGLGDPSLDVPLTIQIAKRHRVLTHFYRYLTQHAPPFAVGRIS